MNELPRADLGDVTRRESGHVVEARRVPTLSERRLVLTYVLALSVIALLSLASHFALDKILREERGSAAVVNVAGRQRMLSQRIVSLVAQSALGDRSSHADLLVSIDEFERAHHALISGNGVWRLAPAASDPELASIYFGRPYGLDAEVREYIDRARRIAAMTPGTPAFARESTTLFRSARRQILRDLDAVVSTHERESEEQIAFLDRVQTAMLAIVLATLLFEAVVIFQPMIRRIMHYAHELLRLATTDPLTGVLNRRSFFGRGAIELERARRYGRPLSVLMIDADHFRKVNDAYGHEGGDAVLMALTANLAEGLRASDLLGRIGGEEFAIVLPETAAAEAEFLANRLRTNVSKLAVSTNRGTAVFTISIGVAEIDRETTELDPVFERADRALYEAKAGGRNRVVSAVPA